MAAEQPKVLAEDVCQSIKRLQARAYNMTRPKALELFVVFGVYNISSLTGRKEMLEISIVAGDLPREQNVFHARA
jgi:hypothetical protein